MAGTMFPSQCPAFNTSMLLPDIDPPGSEILSASWARALAQNTGWLAWFPEPLPYSHDTTIEPDGTHIAYGKLFLTSGTWVVYAMIKCSSDCNWLGTYAVDGTEIINDYASDATTFLGTGTIVIPDDSLAEWTTIEMRATQQGGLGDVSVWFAGFYRPYAPVV